jgi:DNA replication protein DnaC
MELPQELMEKVGHHHQDVNGSTDKDVDAIVKKLIEESKEIEIEMNMEKAEKQILSSGLGKRFQKRLFSTFEVSKDNERAFKLCKDFCNKFPDYKKGILLAGNYGTGKTHLAASIANELIKKGFNVCFINATDLIFRIKDTYRKGSTESEYHIIQKLSSYDLLILDDLGKENATDNTATIFYQIINRIYENDKPIVISTNASSKQIEEKFLDKGKAMVSRLGGMCETLILSGKDRRMIYE